MSNESTVTETQKKQKDEKVGRNATLQGGKFLTFSLIGEEYGLEILKVQEIIGIMAITPVPRTPEFVKGVINLRGKIIPITDLRQKFQMNLPEQTSETCVIVVQIAQNGNKLTMGIVVDKVSEVLDIATEQVETPPSFGVNVDISFILGMGKVGNKVIIILDVDKVLSGKEIAIVDRISKKSVSPHDDKIVRKNSRVSSAEKKGGKNV